MVENTTPLSFTNIKSTVLQTFPLMSEVTDFSRKPGNRFYKEKSFKRKPLVSS